MVGFIRFAVLSHIVSKPPTNLYLENLVPLWREISRLLTYGWDYGSDELETYRSTKQQRLKSTSYNEYVILMMMPERVIRGSLLCTLFTFHQGHLIVLDQKEMTSFEAHLMK